MPEITLLEKRLPYIRMANAKLQLRTPGQNGTLTVGNPTP